MPSINVHIKIIQASQPIPIKASITNVGVKDKRGNYREPPIKEYTSCENVVFYPVKMVKQ